MKFSLLGQLLIDANKITKEQLDEALKYQKKNGGLLGIVLIELDFLTEEDLVKYITIQTTIIREQHEKNKIK